MIGAGVGDLDLGTEGVLRHDDAHAGCDRVHLGHRARQVESMAPDLGTIVGGEYRIRRLLGSGGMGAVYEAEQASTSQLRAMSEERIDVAEEIARVASGGWSPTFEKAIGTALVPRHLAEDGTELEIAVRRLADDLRYGLDASRFVGSGIDYVQSRPFVEGDPVRHVRDEAGR